MNHYNFTIAGWLAAPKQQRPLNKMIFLFLFLPGFLINFISAPVISAFTSAVSIQVATSQIKGLLGLKVRTQHTRQDNEEEAQLFQSEPHCDSN